MLPITLDASRKEMVDLPFLFHDILLEVSKVD